ncbi:tRNA (adenosine(37)-N6)-dimethylallyltransferase MiaA [Candidatus Falkowbacteria bacterium]|nr:tRNA (adenosine(37)-N6)-dimethylallyltransferase MiaA [Candidatus Falkowbacteria bacterium]
MGKFPLWHHVVVIVGPTSSGKTKTAVKLAVVFNGEIISADSRQVYRGMDVGTGKDLLAYTVTLPKKKSKIQSSKSQKIQVHLIDVVSPRTDFTVADYQAKAYRAIRQILARGHLPIIVGGSGLYVSAVTEGYQLHKIKSSKSKVKKVRRGLDGVSLPQLLARLQRFDPETFAKINHRNRRHVQRALEIYYLTGRPKSIIEAQQKPQWDFLKIGLSIPKIELHRRIDERLTQRLEREGMAAEVARLHREGISWRRLESFGLEYQWLARLLQNKIDYPTMRSGLSRDIKHFVKRQLTWWRRDKEIMWLGDYRSVEKRVREFLTQNIKTLKH